MYNNRGILYANWGKNKEAEADYNKAIKLNPNDLKAHNNRGNLYYNLGKNEEAEKDYTKAIELNPNYIQAYNNKALLYLNLLENKNEQKDINDIIKYFEINKKNIYGNTFEKFAIYIKNNLSKEIYMRLINQNLYNKVASLKNEELKNNLYKLYCISEEILEINKFEFDNEHKELAHYTKQDLAITIFSDKKSKLRLNNSIYANDPEEGELFKKLIGFIEDIENNKNIRQLYKNNNNVYFTCFSTNIDKPSSLPMWVNYSNQATGCILVFDNEFFKLEKDDFTYSYSISNDKYLDKTTQRNKDLSYIELYKVIYLNEDEQIETDKIEYKDTYKKTSNKVGDFKDIYEKIMELCKTSKLNEEQQNIVDEVIYDIVQYTSFLFKAKHFEYEEEVRIIKRIEDNDPEVEIKEYKLGENIPPRLYAEIDREIKPKEVILGSRCNDKEAMAKFLYNKGIKKVTQSKLKYK